MTIKYLPDKQMRIQHARGVDDASFEANSGNATIDNEDIPVIGSWQDFTGSGSVSPSQISVAGTANTLQGTDAGLLGEKDFSRTDRGANKATTRTRKIIHYIDNL